MWELCVLTRVQLVAPLLRVFMELPLAAITQSYTSLLQRRQAKLPLISS